jgi:hypothetical protein
VECNLKKKEFLAELETQKYYIGKSDTQGIDTICGQKESHENCSLAEFDHF